MLFFNYLYTIITLYCIIKTAFYIDRKLFSIPVTKDSVVDVGFLILFLEFGIEIDYNKNVNNWQQFRLVCTLRCADHIEV